MPTLRTDPEKIPSSLKEAVADAVGNIIYGNVSGAGEFGTVVYGAAPSRRFVSGFLLPQRETDDGVFTVEASLPAVISVTEKINEPRFPSFKGIMAAKKKEVTTLTLAEIGVEADEVGVENAGSKVLSATPKPPKTAGEKITDEGEGGTAIADYLVAQKII